MLACSSVPPSLNCNSSAQYEQREKSPGNGAWALPSQASSAKSSLAPQQGHLPFAMLNDSLIGFFLLSWPIPATPEPRPTWRQRAQTKSCEWLSFCADSRCRDGLRTPSIGLAAF